MLFLLTYVAITSLPARLAFPTSDEDPANAVRVAVPTPSNNFRAHGQVRSSMVTCIIA